MNRTDRLLAIVLELQRSHRRPCRGEDLARRFEVSTRTIYRDIQALCEAGVPIVLADRQGYRLAEGYFLPPLRFTPDEALVLALGSEVMATTFDQEYRTAAQSAYRKIDVVLPTPIRDRVEELRRGLAVTPVRQLSDAQLGTLRVLREAVAARTRVCIHYARHDAETGDAVQTAREVDPYRLTRFADDWYLTGYCHLRQAQRVFRLARIDSVAPLAQTFAGPVDGEANVRDGRLAEPFFVQVLFDHRIARWARESPRGTVIDEEATSEGLRLTLFTPSQSDLVRWLLGWGGDVRVLEPEWLRAELIGHAERLLRSYRAIFTDE